MTTVEKQKIEEAVQQIAELAHIERPVVTFATLDENHRLVTILEFATEPQKRLFEDARWLTKSHYHDFQAFCDAERTLGNANLVTKITALPTTALIFEAA